MEAYWDVDSWAICYGNRSFEGEKTTKEDCDERLKGRIDAVMNYVQNKYHIDLNENQLIALTSLHFNVKNPIDVVWRANEGYSDQSVANAIQMYVLAGGQKLSGLVNRRNEEAKLFLKK